MDKNDNNDFDWVSQGLNGVIGIVSCGCTMSDDERRSADYLKYRCRVFIEEYSKRFNRSGL